jgi:hypothetical protein
MLQRVPEHLIDVEQDTEQDDPVFCVFCRHLITRSRFTTSHDGHEHVFANPRGLVFRVVCYEDAPGTTSEGIATGEFTWFKGFLWQIALCRGCGEHMGWRYAREDGAEAFYGLIKNNLTDQG